MRRDERDYLLARAEAGLECAQAATNEKAVRAHYVLAALYLDRAYPPADTDADATASRSQPRSTAPASGRGGLERSRPASPN